MRWLSFLDLGTIQPLLTLRGLLLEAFLVYLLLGPVTQQSDIVASVLSFSLLGIHIIVMTVTFFKGRSLKRTLKIDLLHGDQLVGGSEGIVTLKLSPFRLPPFFILKIELLFEQEGVLAPVSIFAGASMESRAVRERVLFPHRGRWRLSRVSCELGDRLGLTSYAWSVADQEAKQVCEVGLPVPRVARLPVVSSSRRAGDAQPHPQDRLGDPFELKRYHPSDGIRRLLWKVYARTGELISRHPEATMTPEGRVAIFCIAGKEDDLLCADCLRYAEDLLTLQLDLMMGCTGMGGRGLAREPGALRDLFLDTVWESDSGDIGAEVNNFINLCQKEVSENSLEKIVIFCAKSFVRTPIGFERCVQVGTLLAESGIKPVFFVRSDESRESASAEVRPINRWFRLVQSAFVQIPTPPESSATLFNRFLGICGGNSWEVVR